MAGQDERTLKMKEEYVSLFEAGMTPKEIAKKFELSSWTVYNYLDEIAKEAGVPRESLLVRPHESPKSREQVSRVFPSADIVGTRERFTKLGKGINELRDEVASYIKQQEELSIDFVREETSWQ